MLAPNYNNDWNTYKDSRLTDELLERDTEWTPDFLELKMKDYHPVFVYGTLKTGGRLSETLDGCPFLGDAHTCTQGYEMDIVPGHDFPIVTQSKSAFRGRIQGEVYMVDPKLFLRLDRIEQNGVMYRRERRYVYLEDQRLSEKAKTLIPSIEAFMYIAVPDYWDGRKVYQVTPKYVGDKAYYDFDVNTKTIVPFH